MEERGNFSCCSNRPDLLPFVLLTAHHCGGLDLWHSASTGKFARRRIVVKQFNVGTTHGSVYLMRLAGTA